MQVLPLLLGLFSCAISSAQVSKTWEGDWIGYLSQGNGGLKSKYSVRLELKSKGDQIGGFCYVEENNLSSKMEITGYWKSKTRFQLKDLRLVNHKEPDNINWCYKTYELELKKEKKEYIIEGNWTGKTKEESCIPGKVYLNRPKPRT